jgi:hypothetical protein
VLLRNTPGPRKRSKEMDTDQVLKQFPVHEGELALLDMLVLEYMERGGQVAKGPGTDSLQVVHLWQLTAFRAAESRLRDADKKAMPYTFAKDSLSPKIADVLEAASEQEKAQIDEV